MEYGGAEPSAKKNKGEKDGLIMCKSAEDLKIEGYRLLMSEVERYLDLDIIEFRDSVRILGMLSYCRMLGIISSEEYDSLLATVGDAYMCD